MKEFLLGNKQGYLDAVKFIQEKHANQYRRFTLTPYWVHPIRVASIVLKYKSSKNIDSLIYAALFHDLIEDTDTDPTYIKEKYGILTSSLVMEVTSNKEQICKDGKTEYLKEKMFGMSSYALVLKLADRLDNISDLFFADKKFVQKYTAETLSILDFLSKNKKDLTITHKILMNDIHHMITFIESSPAYV